MFYLSEAPCTYMTPFSPSPLYTYSRREGGRERELTKEMVREAIAQPVKNTNMTD